MSDLRRFEWDNEDLDAMLRADDEPAGTTMAAAITPAQSAALRGALESVETTDEARAILESMTKAYP